MDLFDGLVTAHGIGDEVISFIAISERDVKIGTLFSHQLVLSLAMVANVPLIDGAIVPAGDQGPVVDREPHGLDHSIVTSKVGLNGNI